MATHAHGLEEPTSNNQENITTYTPGQVSGILHVSERTLANWRHEEIGPRYVRIGSVEGSRGGRVIYEASALREYIDANTVETDVTGLRAPKHRSSPRRARKGGAR